MRYHLRIAVLFVVLMLGGISLLAGVTGADGSFGPDDFSTDPFAARWVRNASNCVFWNAGPQNVNVGSVNNADCSDFNSAQRMQSPGTFFADEGGVSVNEDDTYAMDFVATFAEDTGFAGGTTFLWFGFKSTGVTTPFTTSNHIAMETTMDTTANCVSISAQIRYSDLTTVDSPESACTLAFGVAHTGSLDYDGSTLTVSLGVLTATLARDTARTFLINAAGIETDFPGLVQAVVDDVGWSYTLFVPPPPSGGPPPTPGVQPAIPAFCTGNTLTLYDTRPEARNGVLWVWNWGDGTQTTTSVPQASHTYSEEKVYTIRVSVQDRSGRITSFSGEVDMAGIGCDIGLFAQLVGPFILALLIILIVALLVQLLTGKRRELRRPLTIAIGILVIAIAIFIYYGWSPVLPGGISLAPPSA